MKIKDEQENIVVEKHINSNNDNAFILRIQEGFQTTKAGTYTAEFVAKDTSGNYTFRSLTFEYND
ncbi:hypothetical protein [uncultured Tenacibaculum sp.]|uniref:hypothetical protein n=1 Tax=uncultured Tenacibaculum sp. TaxID=174713 RepID=UPI002630466B|nr:hypothetical protein [uncultured Tenacibaculum sp.]